jgi:hypothetical protein
MGPLQTREGTTVLRAMTVDQYIERARPMFERDGFTERELARRVERFGHLAHVWSTYEGRIDRADAKPIRGVNSIQLVHDGKRWWITSVLWQQEDAANELPAEYLPRGK